MFGYCSSWDIVTSTGTMFQLLGWLLLMTCPSLLHLASQIMQSDPANSTSLIVTGSTVASVWMNYRNFDTAMYGYEGLVCLLCMPCRRYVCSLYSSSGYLHNVLIHSNFSVTSLDYTLRSAILKFHKFNLLCWSFCKSNCVQMCAFCLFVHNALGCSVNCFVHQCNIIIIFKWLD
jgi:hypothetical protein